MAQEIERKFLVRGDGWRQGGEPVFFRQGYLSSHAERVVRVRRAGNEAWLTIKGLNDGASRAEFEYSIPVADAEMMLASLCEKPVLEKCRTQVVVDGWTWEIDEFLGDNAGLIVAEIELPSADAAFPRPDWIGREVTGDARYFNSNLLAHPYAQWAGEP